MKRAVSMVVVSTFLLALAALAQGQMPAPAPELKKLGYFTGTWTTEGEIKPGPMGPGGKFTGTDNSKWMGNYFVVIDSEMKMPMGEATGLGIMGFDNDAKKYTYHGFNSMGEADKAMGDVNGDDWVWTNKVKMGEMEMSGRYSMKVLSPTSYSFKYEVSSDGTKWTTVMDGTATRK